MGSSKAWCWSRIAPWKPSKERSSRLWQNEYSEIHNLDWKFTILIEKFSKNLNFSSEIDPCILSSNHDSMLINSFTLRLYVFRLRSISRPWKAMTISQQLERTLTNDLGFTRALNWVNCLHCRLVKDSWDSPWNWWDGSTPKGTTSRQILGDRVSKTTASFTGFSSLLCNLRSLKFWVGWPSLSNFLSLIYLEETYFSVWMCSNRSAPWF